MSKRAQLPPGFKVPTGAKVLGINVEALGGAKAHEPAPSPRGPRATPHPNRMNKTEARYAEHLEMRRLAGEIREFAYQPEKFRLADATYYAPDFRIILMDWHVEFHEVKGNFWEEDARAKIKIAAELHPYPFIRAIWVAKEKRWDVRRVAGRLPE